MGLSAIFVRKCRDPDSDFDFDFLPSLCIATLLLGGDSSSETVRPDRKNVLSSIDISIMPCATLCTSPFSYSKTCSTFRTVAVYLFAIRASLGGVTFIHSLKLTTCMLAFVFQLSFEFKPSCVIGGFSQFGLAFLNCFLALAWLSLMACRVCECKPRYLPLPLV